MPRADTDTDVEWGETGGSSEERSKVCTWCGAQVTTGSVVLKIEGPSNNWNLSRTKWVRPR